MLLEFLLTINLLTSKPEYLDINEYSDLKLRQEVKQEKVEIAEPAVANQNRKPASPVELKALFTRYAGEYGVDAQILENIARCESHFNPGAVNGPYAGIYQFTASTWSSTRVAMGQDSNPDLRFNAEESIKTTAFKISRGGISAWPVCGR